MSCDQLNGHSFCASLDHLNITKDIKRFELEVQSRFLFVLGTFLLWAVVEAKPAERLRLAPMAYDLNHFSAVLGTL